MPEENPEVVAAVAAERTRMRHLMAVVQAHPGDHVTCARASAAASQGYSLAEAEARWGEHFKVQQ